MKYNVDQIVSKALEKEPEYEPKHGFAERVMATIERRIAARESKRDRLWLIIGLLSILLAFVYVLTAVQFAPSVGVFTFFSGYAGVVIFGVLFITALSFVDKILLRKTHDQK